MPSTDKTDPLDLLVSHQQALIDALDSRDIAAIERAVGALADVVETCRSAPGWRVTPERRATMEHALRQSDAARIRVNCLTDWTRQRLDRLAELRAGTHGLIYAPR